MPGALCRSHASGLLTALINICRQSVRKRRRHPVPHGRRIHSLAAGEILQLVLADLTRTEVASLRMPEVVPAHRGGWRHREALGEVQPGVFLSLQKPENRSL